MDMAVLSLGKPKKYKYFHPLLKIAGVKLISTDSS